MELHDGDEVGSVTLTPEDRAKYIAAGLPLPIYTRRDRKATDPQTTIERFQHDAKIGSLVHQTLAKVVEPCLTMDALERTRLVAETVTSLIHGVAGLGRGDKALARISSLAAQYLTHFLPPSGVVFLGAEVTVRTGRVDLAWHQPGVGMWFDEIKTWRGVGALVDDSTLRQVYKYLDHGVDAFGDDFLGVRLLPLGHLHSALLVRPNGTQLPLDDLDLFVQRKDFA